MAGHNFTSALWLDITSLQPYVDISSALWLYITSALLLNITSAFLAVHHFSLVAEHHFSLFGWTASSWWGPFTKDVLSNFSLLNPLSLIRPFFSKIFNKYIGKNLSVLFSKRFVNGPFGYTA